MNTFPNQVIRNTGGRVGSAVAFIAAAALLIGCSGGGTDSAAVGAELLGQPTTTINSTTTSTLDTAKPATATPTTATPDTPAPETTLDISDPTSAGDDQSENDLDELDDSDIVEPDQPDSEPDQPDQDDDQEDQADNPVDLEPVPEDAPQPVNPCDELVADGSSLVVGPDPLVLDESNYEGSLTIVNCSDGDIDWTAKTKPSVSLATPGANLLPGETAELPFTIDSDAWGPGAIEFKIKVSEPGHNHYVDVHAYRPLVGSDLVGGSGNLSGGQGVGGCTNQCIVSAVLKPNFSSPSLALEITTNTRARIITYVSTQPPVGDDGAPNFPGMEPIDVSPVGVTNHLADLSPLAAGTKYYIIVSATDINEHTSYRSGSFTTITPVENPDDFQLPGGPPGCANQCITSAVVTAGADHTSKHLEITSHTAAQFQVFVSDEAPQWNGNVPSFADTDVWVPSGLEYITQWETNLEGLEQSTTYHIIVQAIDANAHVSYRVGQFHTPAPPTYDVMFTVLGIHVDQDGDHGGNAGELRFAWRVGDEQVGHSGESDIDTGDWGSIPRSVESHIAHDVTDWLPTVYVSATERDPDGLIEFCSYGLGAATYQGSSADCDTVWSVAGSGIVGIDSIDGLPLCTDFGFSAAYNGRHCMVLETGHVGGGYPEITAYVAVQVL